MKDSDIIKELRKGNTRVFREVYNSYPMIESMVLKNSGTKEEAKDLFQNALIIFYRNIQKPDFELTSKLSSYLYGICDRNWKKYLTRDKHRNQKDIADVRESSYQDEYKEDSDTPDAQKVLNDLFDEIGEPCRGLLIAHEFQKLSFDEIAEKFGYANAHTARNQKYKCLQRLKKLVPESIRQAFMNQ